MLRLQLRSLARFIFRVPCAIDGQKQHASCRDIRFTLNWQILMQMRTRTNVTFVAENVISAGGGRLDWTGIPNKGHRVRVLNDLTASQMESKVRTNT